MFLEHIKCFKVGALLWPHLSHDDPIVTKLACTVRLKMLMRLTGIAAGSKPYLLKINQNRFECWKKFFWPTFKVHI